jgi:hypothetical protein
VARAEQRRLTHDPRVEHHGAGTGNANRMAFFPAAAALPPASPVPVIESPRERPHEQIFGGASNPR